MAAFFINRPIFATVLAILLMLAGGLALRNLPIAQYPDIASPQISIFGQYPGASAATVDQSVTQLIEQQMKGIDNLLYMHSSSDAYGSVEMVFTFEAGTNIDIAQVQVQNKLQQALPMLPESVQRQGLQVSKAVENSFMTIAFYVDDASMSAGEISDYVASNLIDQLNRVEGVGSTTLYGGVNAMRIWCDPAKMEQYRLNPQDIVAAVQAQNAQVSGGQTGAAPALPGQETSITVNAASRLQTVDAFQRIRLRTEADGSILRLGQAARVEINEETFMGQSRFNGHPAVGVAVKLASGANVIKTTDAIKAELASLSRFFPQGMQYSFADDRAPIVEKSISSVVRTLLEAVALVVAVMFLFLQSFRSTLIPAITVPVVLLGVFAVLSLAGYSINTLTMFGMVLAIGLLVDDAIVVVENVERLMRDEMLSPREAALKSMREITGALVGVAVVISAVFVPMAFMSGSTGVIYRQFSITIVTAMVLSVLVAIVLTPALCATMLHRHAIGQGEGLFGRFNRWFDRLTRRYAVSLRPMLDKPKRWVGFFVAGLAVCVVLLFQLPGAFLPEEDQGILFLDIQLPPGASFERTAKVLAQVEDYFRQDEKEAVESVFTVMGWGFSGTGQGSGMAFALLKDWSERGKGQGVFDIMNRANARFADTPEAQLFVMAPPAVMELDNSSGFSMQLMDRGNRGHHALMAAKDALLQKAAGQKAIGSARYSGLDDAEQYRLIIDSDKAGAQGLDMAVVNGAIGAYWGGEYINDFVDKGRTKKVYLQAEPAFRSSAEDFRRYHVRNNVGEMVPFASFIDVESINASPKLTRYQGVPAVKIEGDAAPGQSSGQAMKAMAASAKDLPAGFDFAWTGLSYQEMLSGDQAPMLYAISLLVVFLSLAALYESWSIPVSVLLAVPTGIVGALAGAWLRGLNNDVYFQIAVLTIVGLSAKNSILIVEFARAQHRAGKSLAAAAIEASRLRLRPIIMTSLCFILGVIPLALSSGAGAGAQNALGTVVMAGMLTATALGIYFTPLFFVLIVKLLGRPLAGGGNQQQS